MRKQFSLKEYGIYALRYAFVAAVCIVLGLGLALGIAVLDKDNRIRYEGQAEIAGITTLYPTADELEREAVSIYGTVCEHAMTAMRNDRNISALYATLGKEYCELLKLKEGNKSKLQFRESFAFSASGTVLRVSFTMEGKLANAAFCEKAVNEYLKIAIASAKTERILADTENSIVQRDAEPTALAQKAPAYVRACILGAVGGLFAGLVLLFAVYFFDPRLASYMDIAGITGKRLFFVGKGDTDASVCPKIDSAMQDDKVLLVCGDASSSERVARLYGKYAAKEKGVLCVLFGARGGDTSPLTTFLDGGAIESCVVQENGLAILEAGCEKLTLADAKKVAALAEKYERVIFAKAYEADGVTAVLAKASDKIVYAYDYKNACVKAAYALAAETGEPKKAAGACIEHAGKGFVGASFVGDEEEEVL